MAANRETPPAVVLSVCILEAIRDWAEHFHSDGAEADEIAKGLGIAAAGFASGGSSDAERDRRMATVSVAMQEATPIISNAVAIRKMTSRELH